MGDIFKDGSLFMRIMEHVADLIILNLLWLVCCIPVITIGTATIALYSTSWKLANQTCSFVVREFFCAFRSEWRQGTILTIIAAGIMLIVVANVNAMLSTQMIVLLFLHASVVVLFLFALCYLFPLQALFQNKLIHTIVNAFVISIVKFPTSCLALVINLLPAFCLLLPLRLWGGAVFFWMTCGFALTAYVNAYLIKRAVSKWISE